MIVTRGLGSPGGRIPMAGLGLPFPTGSVFLHAPEGRHVVRRAVRASGLMYLPGEGARHARERLPVEQPEPERAPVVVRLDGQHEMVLTEEVPSVAEEARLREADIELARVQHDINEVTARLMVESRIRRERALFDAHRRRIADDEALAVILIAADLN